MTAIVTTSTSHPGPGRLEQVRGERSQILGCPIDRVDLDQALRICEEAIASSGFAQHMAINVAKLMALREDQQLRESIERCELVTADGQPIVWASRLLHDPLPSRVTGIDLMQGLLARAAVAGYRIYILGAKPDVLDKAVARIREQHPGVAIVGHRDGYYADAEEEAVADQIAAARPDILFVAMSSPRKEYFLIRHGRTVGVPFVMGVGGAIDVIAGVTRRAPEAMQQLGLEWLFRLAQEPRRLARRYALTNSQFLLALAREVARTPVTSASHTAWLRAGKLVRRRTTRPQRRFNQLQRSAVPRKRGGTVWFSGPSDSAPTAAALARRIAQVGWSAHVVDGEQLRRGLNSDLGFEPEELVEHARRAAHVARLLAESGAIAIVNLPTPHPADYETARRIHDESGVALLKVLPD
jgi:N-acetylglucosaminyldiphosphoundecaprenol N-acetyl-beta-D-mannosaminyltransferase